MMFSTPTEGFASKGNVFLTPTTNVRGPSRKSRSPLGPLFRKINHLRCKTWDLVHAVDTSGDIPLTSLDFSSEHKSPGLEYQSHHPKILLQMLSALDIDHEQYGFIDYGCGKGRVLLVASEFPFRWIVGVEFAPQLAQTAKKNLKTYRGGHTKCRDVKVLTLDATRYELPLEPAVLFFYSPFTGSVMERVVGNIVESLKKSPRTLYVVFTGIEIMRDRAFGSRPEFKRLMRERYFDIYQHSD